MYRQGWQQVDLATIRLEAAGFRSVCIKVLGKTYSQEILGKSFTNLVTGHNTLGSHMIRLRIVNDGTCGWSGEAVEDSYCVDALHYLVEDSSN